jgi:hypothetical protein
MHLNEINLTLNIDGVGLIYGTFPQWKELVSSLSEGRGVDYTASVRCCEESLTSAVNYLLRTSRTTCTEPEAFGLRQNPVTPPDSELVEQLLAA